MEALQQKINLQNISDEEIMKEHQFLIITNVRGMINKLRVDCINKYFKSEEDYKISIDEKLKKRMLVDFDYQLKELICLINGYEFDPLFEVKIKHGAALGTWRLNIDINRSGHYEQTS